jgi:polysaccharide biosynthesis protein PslH
MTRVLFTTPELQHPPRGGPKLRIENSIKALNRLSDLVIVSRVPAQQMGGDRAIGFYQKLCRKFLFMADVAPETAALGLSELAVVEKSDVLWLGYGNISYEILHHLKALRFPLPVVIDTDSVWSRFVLRGLPYKPTFEDRCNAFASGWFKRWEEWWGTQAAHITTAVSPFDAEYYKLLTPRPGGVAVFSNVIDFENYHNPPPNPGLRKPCIYLAGTFGPDSPMEEAALWIIDRVLPLASQTFPNLHFYVVGVGATEKMKQRAGHNVTITGALDSVLPYLAHADVSVVPLKYESGTRFKIMEAAACRVPIVSTTLGAEGIPVTHGTDILIADTPEQFAQSIIQIIRDPQLGKRLAENCYQLIERDCSIATATSQAEAILSSLQSPKPEKPASLDEDTQTISSLAYRLNRSAQLDDRLTAGLLLFNRLMKRLGQNRTFVESEELQQTHRFLQEAVAVAPRFRLLNEALQICEEHLHSRRSTLAPDQAATKFPSGAGAEAKGATPSAVRGLRPTTVQPEGIHKLLADGGRLLQNGQAAAALSLIEDAGVPDAKIAGVSLLRFRCLARLGKNVEAIQAALAELSLTPDNQSVLTAVLGDLQITEQEIQASPAEILKGLDELCRHIRRGQLQVRGIERARALCLLKVSRTQEAMAALERETTVSPQDSSVQALLQRLQQAEAFESELVPV